MIQRSNGSSYSADTRGRHKRPERQVDRAAWLARFERSGAGLAEFCYWHKLPVSTLLHWRRQARRAAAIAESELVAVPTAAVGVIAGADRARREDGKPATFDFLGLATCAGPRRTARRSNYGGDLNASDSVRSSRKSNRLFGVDLICHSPSRGVDSAVSCEVISPNTLFRPVSKLSATSVAIPSGTDIGRFGAAASAGAEHGDGRRCWRTDIFRRPASCTHGQNNASASNTRGKSRMRQRARRICTGGGEQSLSLL